jgi:ATP-dependent DNA helicase RecQ
VFPDRTLIEMAQARPATLDAMARINGVGAKKLESYGAEFLAVIAGETAPMHPARRKLAGREAGSLFDRLHDAQQQLSRGDDGTGRLLSCPPATLRRIAETRPRTRADLERLGGLNGPKLDRFADAFLSVIAEE